MTTGGGCLFIPTPRLCAGSHNDLLSVPRGLVMGELNKMGVKGVESSELRVTETLTSLALGVIYGTITQVDEDRS